MNKFMEYVKELWIYILVIIIVILIKIFIFTPIRVNGPSMNETLEDKDIMILDEISYRFSSIDRFDIVVVKYKNKHIIKRVIGLPGEKVKYIDNKLYINDKYIKENFSHKKTNDFDEIVVPDGEYFVLGDNRINSVDSRIIGTIPKSKIKGKTSLTLFPISRFGNKK